MYTKKYHLLLNAILMTAAICSNVSCTISSGGNTNDIEIEKPNGPSENGTSTIPEDCSGCLGNELCLDGRCVCTPNCNGSHARGDGCGGRCSCPDGKTTNAAGNCVDRKECINTCEKSDWQCGNLCGVTCGQCDPDQRCDLGQCTCEPRCDGSRCDDGCGGTCECPANLVCDPNSECVSKESCHASCESEGATCGKVCGRTCGQCGDREVCVEGNCEAAVSCEDCSLKLTLLMKEFSGENLSRITLSVLYQPHEKDPRPRMLDLRIRADESARLEKVEMGQALIDAGKTLYSDPSTGDYWKVRNDGTIQMMAFSVGNITEISSGNLVNLTYVTNEGGAVAFSLVRHHQTFAPALPDMTLQATDYDRPLKVTR